MTEAKSEATNVKVMVRMRLFNKREIAISEQKKETLRPCVKMRGKTCAIVEYTVDDKGFTHEREREAFDFDECFWSMPAAQYQMAENEYATQLMVYKKSGYLAMQAAFEGFNVCIFAYGQTGSGKTYSMLGCPGDEGISPRLVDDLFANIRSKESASPTTKIVVECMFYEIYNEKVRDLFNKNKKIGDYDNPRIRQHPTKGVFVEGLTRRETTEAEEAKSLIEKGTLERAMAETKMNANSSRSHAIFQISVTQNDALKGTKKTSFINLVDLAGSEKVKLSQVTGSALTEAKNINQSLSTLRRVIDVLIENSQTKKQQVPPFRESVLTYVLSDSLGGNSKTQMIATISPHEANMEDTIGTLRYALRARSIVCEAKVNEEESAAMMNTMREEIMKLRQAMREGVSQDGGIVTGVASEELQRELAEREAEMAKLEEEQQRNEELVRSLKEKVAEMDAMKQELTVTVNQQKRERFATAFRNAFLIARDKKKIEEHFTELLTLRSQVADLRKSYEMAEVSIAEQGDLNRELVVENDRLTSSMVALREETDHRISQLESLNRSLSETKLSYESRLSEAERESKMVKDENLLLQEKSDRLTMDLTGLAHAAEREQLEKNRLRAALEKSVTQQTGEVEALKRRKERYKQQVAEERQKCESYCTQVAMIEGDRAALLETIKAMQRLLQEKDFLVAAANKECDECRQKLVTQAAELQQKNETVRVLQEALNEYQHAAGQWMSDLSTKDKEVCRLRSMSDEMRSVLDVKRSSVVITGSKSLQTLHSSPSSVKRTLSPFRGAHAALTPPNSSPSRNQSPLASRVRALSFNQPAVELIGSPPRSAARLRQ
jgi:hypothetical protein